MIRTFFALIPLVIATAVDADVQLRIQDSRSGNSTLSGNAQVARVDNASRQQYVIFDFKLGEMQMVDPARGQIFVTRLDGPAGAAPSSPALRLEDRGKGPRIAGYPTRQLALLADGRDCGRVFTSQPLLRDPGIRALFDAMRGLQKMAQGMGNAFSGMQDGCERAQQQLFSALDRHGVPMRVTDANGNPVSEVLEVVTDKRIAASHYQAPTGMTRVDMQQQVNQAMQQGREMMKNMPDMTEMMEQLQSGGEMNAEMMRQLEKMQQMLQQMEPQQ